MKKLIIASVSALTVFGLAACNNKGGADNTTTQSTNPPASTTTSPSTPAAPKASPSTPAPSTGGGTAKPSTGG